MALSYREQNRYEDRVTMRNAVSTLEIGSKNLKPRPRDFMPQPGDDVATPLNQDAPTLPRHKKGHKRSRSDVTQLLDSRTQTLPNGFIPPFNRTNSTGSGKKKSFFAGIANKVKTAWEGKQDPNKNISFAFTASELGNVSSDSSPMVARNTKFAGSSKVKHANSVPTNRMSSNRLSVPADRQKPGYPWDFSPRVSPHPRRSSVFSNSSSDYGFDFHTPPPSPEMVRSGTAALTRACSPPVVVSHELDRRSSDLAGDSVSSTSSNGADVNLLVMGAEGVGKSALIVRYLTKRFIGEYAPNVESVYDQAMNIDGKEVNVHVWDSGIPSILQKSAEKSDTEQDEDHTPHLREALSVTSLTSSVTSSISSTSSAYDCRFSNGSIEEDQILKIFGPTSLVENPPTLSDKKHEDKRTASRRKAQKTQEVNNNRNSGDHEMHVRLNWCNGIIVVYSICEPESFEAARDVIRYVRGQYVRGHAVTDLHSPPGCRSNSISGESSGSESQNRFSRLPILLVGNKSDLEHRRRVDLRALHAFTAAYSCSAVELSVSDGFEPVSRAFNEIVETIRKNKLPSKMTRIKSIVRNVSGTFGHRRNMSM